MNRKEARENAFLLIFESVARPDVDKQEIFDIAVVDFIDIIKYEIGQQITLEYKIGEKTNTVTALK